MRDAGECAVRKQVLACSLLARRRLLSLPSTLPPRHFVLGQGGGSRARAGALCPRPQGALGVPLGHPRDPARHISGPLGTFEGFSGTTPGGVKGLQSSWNDR